MTQAAAVNKWLVTGTMSLVSLMVLLDMTIANVALPHMMGAFGANSQQVTWVLTAYTMAEAIFIPLTGFISKKLGQRHLLLFSVSGFVVASMLCGQAQSLEEIVFFRVLQGACGACTMPLAQSVIADAFPSKERGQAMAIYSMGIVMGPVLGPALGGIIIEHTNWRWIFYINLPLGLIGLLCIYLFIHVSDKGKTVFDWATVMTMAVGLALFQIVVDQGNEKDWFNSQFIVLAGCLSVVFLVFFIHRSVTTKSDIAALWLFRDRNLALASLIIFVTAFALFGILALQPVMMQNLMGYPVETTGLLMATRGISSAITMILVGRMLGWVRAHWLVGVGLVFSALSLYMMSDLTLDLDNQSLIIPSLVQGVGMAFIFVPLSTVAYETLEEKYHVHGASLFNLCRTIGSSIGISIATTFQSRMNDAELYSLGTGIVPSNPILQNSLLTLEGAMNSMASKQFLVQSLIQQAGMLSYIEAFRFFFWVFVFICPLIFLFKKNEGEPVEA